MFLLTSNLIFARYQTHKRAFQCHKLSNNLLTIINLFYILNKSEERNTMQHNTFENFLDFVETVITPYGYAEDVVKRTALRAIYKKENAATIYVEMKSCEFKINISLNSPVSFDFKVGSRNYKFNKYDNFATYPLSKYKSLKNFLEEIQIVYVKCEPGIIAKIIKDTEERRVEAKLEAQLKLILKNQIQVLTGGKEDEIWKVGNYGDNYRHETVIYDERGETRFEVNLLHRISEFDNEKYIESANLQIRNIPTDIINGIVEYIKNVETTQTQEKFTIKQSTNEFTSWLDDFAKM